MDGMGDHKNGNDTAVRNGGNDNTRVRLYVSNINYAMSWQDLKDTFRDKGNFNNYVQCEA